MKLKLITSTFMIMLAFLLGCEDEMVVNTPTTELNDTDITLVSDEVAADLSFAELLDEGDDGTFWGDNNFVTLKSAEINAGTCPARTVEWEDNMKTVTLEFSGEDCPKNGTIIIEYFKPNDGDPFKKKTITYIDFTKDEVTFNGTKEITRGNDNYEIKAEMEIDKTSPAGNPVKIIRKYHRQVHWLCGLDTRDIVEDNIKTVTGSSEITRIENGEERSYKRQILSPLLIVRACDLKIQAGTVKIEKADGTVIKIDYGKMDHDIDCDADFECKNTFEVTKGDETFTMEFIDGKRVRQTTTE